MKWNVFIILIISTVFAQCSNDAAKANDNSKNIIVERDTTITPANAFSVLQFDSSFVQGFIKDYGIDTTIAGKIHNFYRNRNYHYAWFTKDGLAEQAQAFWNLHEQYVNYSKDSTQHNKNLHRYMRLLLEDNSNYKLLKDTVAHVELLLTEHFFEFTNYAYTGSLNPEEMQWNIPRKKVDAVALLDSLINTNGKNLEDWEPVNNQYKRMKVQLLKYYDLEKSGSFTPLSLGSHKFLKKGDSAKVVVDIKKRLHFLGDLTTDDVSAKYNDALENAVIRFQQRHGLQDDGAVGQGTLKELNVPLEKRIEQMLINMERMRWMPETPKGRRAVANIPEFKLYVYEDESVALSMNIVVGKEGSSTVIFNDELEYVVFSPYWNVPSSITRNEIVPAMRRNSNYLARNNMEITGYNNGVPVVRQKPGGSNALGNVKFIFPNRYNIYFHDTPSKSLFSREKRAFSHGCIRVSQPFELAKYFLSNQPEWTDESIREAMNAGTEKWVKLEKGVPVFISYFTSWVDANGIVHFREDIYGHDAKMAQRMFKHETH